jgi:hypothetical protein
VKRAALRTLELRRERWADQDRAKKAQAAAKAREATEKEHDTEPS